MNTKTINETLRAIEKWPPYKEQLVRRTWRGYELTPLTTDDLKRLADYVRELETELEIENEPKVGRQVLVKARE